MKQWHLAPELFAGVSWVALAQDDPAAALACVEEILCQLETKSVDGTDEPFSVYLTYYRVLEANEDSCAVEILVTAHRPGQQRVSKIDNDELRRSYSENVAANRESVREWQSAHRIA